MKERPILFSAPMVSALLDGRKTMTRRIMKPQMSYEDVCGMFAAWSYPITATKFLIWPNAKDKIIELCPYGRPGDRLWVRETWRGLVTINSPHEPRQLGVARYVPDQKHCVRVEYLATRDRDNDLWRPSIHMPRWASRILLEITDVRVELLQSMDPSDVEREGVTHPDERMTCREAIERFTAAWDGIHGPGSWDENPWVWVIEFVRVEAE
ncbi:hypothetical protein [Amantichitinum ursilacus]|uniref:ASCH domain protein n=1 Tax=Amantichitinum ursilacus TaxID=857265 RepID=A0A0N0XIL3_9NEIS|nr:hypothetical protein [Amantichitinum ursilacus]KPC52999.1 hypothetical protein WG78_10930 [Amantichitinum ursilacus]